MSGDVGEEELIRRVEVKHFKVGELPIHNKDSLLKGGGSRICGLIWVIDMYTEQGNGPEWLHQLLREGGGEAHAVKF